MGLVPGETFFGFEREKEIVFFLSFSFLSSFMTRENFDFNFTSSREGEEEEVWGGGGYFNFFTPSSFDTQKNKTNPPSSPHIGSSVFAYGGGAVC